jgi:hypothetical protein
MASLDVTMSVMDKPDASTSGAHVDEPAPVGLGWTSTIVEPPFDIDINQPNAQFCQER